MGGVHHSSGESSLGVDEGIASEMSAFQWGITVYEGVDRLSKVIYRQDMRTQQACIEWLYAHVGAARVEQYKYGYDVFMGGKLLR